MTATVAPYIVFLYTYGDQSLSGGRSQKENNNIMFLLQIEAHLTIGPRTYIKKQCTEPPRPSLSGRPLNDGCPYICKKTMYGATGAIFASTRIAGPRPHVYKKTMSESTGPSTHPTPISPHPTHIRSPSNPHPGPSHPHPSPSEPIRPIRLIRPIPGWLG